MKTYTSKFKSSFILLALVATPLWAKPVAQVTEVMGSVFAITSDGKTIALKVDAHIEEKSELMVEEGASITLNDYYDATYHLIGGTHLKLFDKSVQLKRGKVWVESVATKNPLALTTANGSAAFSKSEFIVTFDQSTSRSQFLVVNGEVEVSNVLDTDMKFIVPAGTFSLIDPEVESGVPRAPTKVGLASLQQSLAEFKTMPDQLKVLPKAAPARTVASVTTEANVEPAPVKKGEIIFMNQGRLPASVKGGAHSYFKKKISVKKVVAEEIAPIRFYGTTWKESVPFETPKLEKVEARTPASVAPIQAAPVAKNTLSSLQIDAEFNSSLKKEVSDQPKYSKELDSLIQDLKSY